MTTTTWVEGAAGSGFDVDHLPYGVFARSGEHPRVAVRIGDFVLDLSIVAAIVWTTIGSVAEGIAP